MPASVVVLRPSNAPSAAGRFQMNFYGEASGAATAVELMEENTEIGIPLARTVQTANVAVRFQHVGIAGVGPWTARLFRNGVLAATFSVATA